MKRLLLVDDEAYVVDGLFDYLQKIKGASLDIVKAYSGKEALENMERMRIDIVLSDINMPNMDGFALCEKIKNSWPHCKIIFLTAYNDFDYAYKALKNGFTYFILKSGGYEEILQTIDKVLAEIKKEDDISDLIGQSYKSINSNEALVNRYLCDLIEDRRIRSDEIEKKFIDLNIELDSKIPVLILMAKIDTWPSNLDNIKKIEMLRTIQSISKYYLFSKEDCFFSCLLYKDFLYWLIQPKEFLDSGKESQWNGLRIYTKGMIESLQTACYELLKLKVSFVICKNPTEWDNVSYNCEIIRLILEMDNNLMQLREYDNYKKTITNKDIEKIIKKIDIDKKKLKGNSSIDIVLSIQRYIEDNYQNNISLIDIAEHVYMNPSYLSRFYKQVCKENLFEYISKVRIERAKEILLNGEVNISEVAFLVGFNSIGYFSNVFKKLVGMTPQEYRLKNDIK